MRIIWISCVLAAAAAQHCGASIILNGPLSLPSGSGASTTILTIGTNDTGSGCVGFAGGADLTGLGACPGGFSGSAGDEMTGTTMTRTIAQLSAAGVSNAQNLVVVLQSPDPGSGSV